MGYPWGTSIGYPWSIHGVSMGYIHRVSVEYPWGIHGVHAWGIRGVSMGSGKLSLLYQSTPCGQPIPGRPNSRLGMERLQGKFISCPLQLYWLSLQTPSGFPMKGCHVCHQEHCFERGMLALARENYCPKPQLWNTKLCESMKQVRSSRPKWVKRGGELHDQGHAKWRVIRRQPWGHNDTPFERPTPGRPVGGPGVGHP
jgi:hypothetical protein